MGRSQVKYNRMHGRPGTKGRGGRGRGSGESSRSQPPQGDNAWRYENDASSAVPEMDLELLDLETQKLPQYVEKTEDENDGQQLVNGINMSALGKALDRLSVAQRLKIPAYLTVDLEVTSSRVATKGGKGMSNEVDNPPASLETRDESGLTAEKQDSDNKADQDPTNDAKDADGNEDDLDTWLDSVIS